ncbi:MAG: FMN-binding protein [Lachnospiraceae bacterium]|nr:FMN-binding protein [Lachnospiraceae bacterium]
MNKYFWTRLIAFCCIAVVLFCYQKKAIKWNAMESDNKALVAEIEQYNKRVKKEMQKAEGKSEICMYEDGTFEGSADGFGGKIIVAVELKEDEILSVSIKEAKGEDANYLTMAKAVLKTMAEKQSTEVDIVSGATYSSKGIINATKAALQKAEKERIKE